MTIVMAYIILTFLLGTLYAVAPRLVTPLVCAPLLLGAALVFPIVLIGLILEPRR